MLSLGGIHVNADFLTSQSRETIEIEGDAGRWNSFLLRGVRVAFALLFDNFFAKDPLTRLPLLYASVPLAKTLQKEVRLGQTKFEVACDILAFLACRPSFLSVSGGISPSDGSVVAPNSLPFSILSEDWSACPNASNPIIFEGLTASESDRCVKVLIAIGAHKITDEQVIKSIIELSKVHHADAWYTHVENMFQ